MSLSIPKISRKVSDISIHCSATRANLDFYGPQATADIGVKEITEWHKARKWSTIGYHFVIRRSGLIEVGRNLQSIPAAVEGHNSNMIGICLVGGVDASNKAENNYMPEQWASLKNLITQLREAFPKTRIMGHREYPGVKKECPCFDVGTWAKLFHVEKDMR